MTIQAISAGSPTNAPASGGRLAQAERRSPLVPRGHGLRAGLGHGHRGLVGHGDLRGVTPDGHAVLTQDVELVRDAGEAVAGRQ